MQLAAQPTVTSTNYVAQEVTDFTLPAHATGCPLPGSPFPALPLRWCRTKKIKLDMEALGGIVQHSLDSLVAFILSMVTPQPLILVNARLQLIAAFVNEAAWRAPTEAHVD